jgi:hypothetical protein
LQKIVSWERHSTNDFKVVVALPLKHGGCGQGNALVEADWTNAVYVKWTYNVISDNWHRLSGWCPHLQ